MHEKSLRSFGAPIAGKRLAFGATSALFDLSGLILKI